MIILSIETSCDETAVSVLHCEGNHVTVLGNALSSQIELHAKYGGVFPALAKRAHAEKIVTLLAEALEQAQLLHKGATTITSDTQKELETLFSHEEGLAAQVTLFVSTHATPLVDHIAVTAGPGLEPALWVGINTALALGKLWNKPVHPINHMEGHVVSALLKQGEDQRMYAIQELSYPVLSLLVSGGHTELVLIRAPLSYEKIGETKDDAVGEAFDKVARVLGLPYPGGPKISAYANEAREQNIERYFKLPRPMIHSGDYHFSYSGLKTAVLYAVKDKETALTEDEKKAMAREFEEAAIEVLVKKTAKAIEAFGIQTLLLGGGVAANTYLRTELQEAIGNTYGTTILFPGKNLSTDNSIMIGMALFYHFLYGNSTDTSLLKANGNLSIGSK